MAIGLDKAVPESDDKVLFLALRAAQVCENLAYTAVQEVCNMDDENVTATIAADQTLMEDRLAAHQVAMEAGFAKLKAELSTLRRIVGIGLAIFIITTVGPFFEA